MFGTIGVVLGTAVGVLPGLGPSVAIAILLPVTFGLDPTAAFILFGGIYYGAMYGGSTTSILINTPGDAASSVTTIDGYPMAKRGQGGVALATAAIGSFIGGTFATFMLMLTATSLGTISLLFGPPEYVALMVLALTLVTAVGGKSVPRTIVALCIGLGLSTIGIDLQTGEARFTFGLPELYGGIDVALGAVGLFAVGEALWLIAAPPSGRGRAAAHEPAVADRSRNGAAAWAPGCAAPSLASRRECCRAPVRRSPRFSRTAWRSDSRRIPGSSGRARSKASPLPKRRTTPPQGRAWCPCWPLAFRVRDDRHHARGVSDVWPSARAFAART